MLPIPDALDKSVRETIDYAVLRHAREMQFPDKLENVLLSRMYVNGVQATKNYHWNVIVGQIHNPAEAHLHHIHSNHYATINHQNNSKSPEGITTMYQSELNVNFLSKIAVEFKTVDEKNKRIEFFVLNRSF